MTTISAANLTITTPEGENSQGISVSVSGPATGSFAGPYSANFINCTFGATVTGAGSSESSATSSVSGWQFVLGVGGPEFSAAETYGASVGCIQTTPAPLNTGDLVGFSSGADALVPTGSMIYGGCAAATATASAPAVYGFEAGTYISTAGAVMYRSGVNAANYGPASSAGFEGAFTATCGSGDVQGGQWQNFLAFRTAGGSLPQPVAPTGNLFASESPATLANVLDLSNVDVTQNIIWGQTAIITGDGQYVGATLRLYGQPAPAPDGQINIGATIIPPGQGNCPSNCAGCLGIMVGATQRCVPFY
jgi:hypothetical protein